VKENRQGYQLNEHPRSGFWPPHLAQPGRGPGGGQGRGWGTGDPYNRMYNPKTCGTLSGEVVERGQIHPREKNVVWGAFTLKTEKRRSRSI